MFSNQRFTTARVSREVPILLQALLWHCIDNLAVPKDYLQVFELKKEQCKQKILHKQEVPEYSKEYLKVLRIPGRCVSFYRMVPARCFIAEMSAFSGTVYLFSEKKHPPSGGCLNFKSIFKEIATGE